MAQASAAIDLDTLSLESFRGQPVAVLGLARSGVALARFLTDRGARVTIYDARSSAALVKQIEQLEGRSVRLLLGPDVDPSTALADEALIATSPSINSRYPTTEPRMREALGGQRGGPVPAALPVDHDRRNRHEGQDDDLIAGGNGAGQGFGPFRAGREHRHPAR
jgi:cation diffusion facilitator CzcD-associated flavoprotein CzcO